MFRTHGPRVFILFFSTVLLSCVIVGAGCGDSSGRISTSPGGTPSPIPLPTPGGAGVGAAPAQASYLYGTYGPTVLGGRITGTGQVVDVPMPTDPNSGDTGFQTGTGGLVTDIATDPKGRFLYTLDVATSSFGMPIGENGLGAFIVDRGSGALKKVAGSPYQLVIRGGSVVEDGTGAFLLVAPQNAGGIDTYSIDQTSGVLTKINTSSGAAGSQLAASWDGRFVFNGGDGEVNAFSIDSGTGALTTVSTVSVQNPGPLFLSYSGKFLYSVSNSGITAMSVSSTGQLAVTQANFPAVQVAGGLPRRMVATSRDDRFAYVATSSGQNVGALQAFSVDPATGAIGNPIGTAVTMQIGESPLQVSLDYNGKFLYATFTGVNMETFAVNPDGSIGTAVVNPSRSAISDFFELSP